MKTVEKLFDFHIVGSFHPLKRAIEKISLIYILF